MEETLQLICFKNLKYEGQLPSIYFREKIIEYIIQNPSVRILKLIPDTITKNGCFVKKLLDNQLFEKLDGSDKLSPNYFTRKNMKLMINSGVTHEVLIKYIPQELIDIKFVKLAIKSRIKCSILTKYIPIKLINEEIVSLMIDNYDYDSGRIKLMKFFSNNIEFVKLAIKNRIECNILTENIPVKLINEEIMSLMIDNYNTYPECQILIKFFSRVLIDYQIVKRIIENRKRLIEIEKTQLIEELKKNCLNYFEWKRKCEMEAANRRCEMEAANRRWRQTSSSCSLYNMKWLKKPNSTNITDKLDVKLDVNKIMSEIMSKVGELDKQLKELDENLKELDEDKWRELVYNEWTHLRDEENKWKEFVCNDQKDGWWGACYDQDYVYELTKWRYSDEQKEQVISTLYILPTNT
jgi:hypothetical protein